MYCDMCKEKLATLDNRFVVQVREANHYQQVVSEVASTVCTKCITKVKRLIHK
jgi:hypothetical protein